MDKQRLLELAGIQINETTDPLMLKAAVAVAGAMMNHYENGIADAYEFFPEDDDVVDWIESNITDMYNQSAKPFRQAVLKAVQKALKL